VLSGWNVFTKTKRSETPVGGKNPSMQERNSNFNFEPLNPTLA